MSQWSDALWLAVFFTQNLDDLMAYFRITNVEDAIFQTMEDRDELACIIMDISPDANLDHFFRPLENNCASEMLLGKEKELTHTMQEREHTLQELEKMEKVRNFLISERVFDDDSFTDYQKEIEP